MRSGEDPRVTVRHLSSPADHGKELAEDARSGLTAHPKRMPSKWFYDTRGSRLFTDITRLPEYYLNRVETEILAARADDIVAAVRPEEIVELGSGYSVKTRLLLDALRRTGTGTHYVPVDISEVALLAAARRLSTDHPWLVVDGYIGDYFTDLPKVPRRGRRLVVMLGSTLGNYEKTERATLLSALAGILEATDGLLVGIDLVKEEELLLAAYDDAAGVTGEFNRNMLVVLNRELDADFDLDAFDYVAVWNDERACVEMGLRARRPITVELRKLDLRISFSEGETLHNEVSCKFTRESARRELGDAGMSLAGWFPDADDRFALALARLSGEQGSNRP